MELDLFHAEALRPGDNRRSAFGRSVELNSLNLYWHFTELRHQLPPSLVGDPLRQLHRILVTHRVSSRHWVSRRASSRASRREMVNPSLSITMSSEIGLSVRTSLLRTGRRAQTVAAMCLGIT